MTELLKQEFKYVGVNILNVAKDFIPYPINKETNADAPIGLSQLGTPVFADLTFLGDTYTDTVNEVTKTVTFKDLKFEAVIMTVNQSKNIVTTQIQGRNGTVKEYIGMGDYGIIINGIITTKNGNGHYPIDEVRDLKLMLNANKPIKVASTYLQNLDIKTIVIKDYEFAQETGGYSYQKFSITAMSDNDQYVYIENI
jgi:hypothetical protein